MNERGNTKNNCEYLVIYYSVLSINIPSETILYTNIHMYNLITFKIMSLLISLSYDELFILCGDRSGHI
jgi:hypothetical protein